jgi:hypothetical protein
MGEKHESHPHPDPPIEGEGRYLRPMGMTYLPLLARQGAGDVGHPSRPEGQEKVCNA